MTAHSNGQAITFCSCGFCLLSIFFSSPQRSEIRCLPYLHTNACLKCASRGSLKIYRTQKLRQKTALCAPSHNFIDNRKKNLLNGSISFICLYNMVNWGPLTAEICWRVWGTPANFNGFRVLASLLHRRRSTEVNQTARCLAVSCTGILCMHFWGLLPHNGIWPAAKFTLRPSLAFS